MLKGFIGLAFAAAISVSPIVAAISASTPAHAFCFFCGGNGGKGGGGVRPCPRPVQLVRVFRLSLSAMVLTGWCVAIAASPTLLKAFRH